MIPVTVEQNIVSSLTGHVGNWTITCNRELRALPHSGDVIELAPGWAAVPVKYVAFLTDGRITVHLRGAQIERADVFEEHEELVRDHGWQQHGGPWENQNPEN